MPDGRAPLTRLKAPRLRRLGVTQRFPDQSRNPCRVVIVRVLLPRPEEAAEAVLLRAGNDVDVQMRDALAHLVVDGYERAVGSERLFHRAGKSLRAREERRDELD